MDYAIVSEKGDRQINEDSAAAVECDGNMLFVLADGLGGHGHGEVASGIVTETARAVLSSLKDRKRIRILPPTKPRLYCLR